MRLRQIIWTILLAVCAAGLLVSWIPGNLAWQFFQLIIDVLVLVWFFGWIVGRFPNTLWPRLLIPFVVIGLWGAAQLSFGWTVYRFATMTEILRWGTFAAIFFLAFQSADRQFCRVLALYGSALAVVSVLQYFAGNGKIFWVFTPNENAGLGPFLNRDHFASFVALVLPAAAFELRHGRKDRWIFAVASAALYASVVASTSRAGFALVTLEVLILCVVLRFRRTTAGAVATVLIAFVLVVGWEALYRRFQIHDPYAGRRELAEATGRIIASTPWKGTGLGTWTVVYPAYAVKDFGLTANAAHNDWLQWAAEGGIPLAGFILVLFCVSAVYVRRAPWALGAPIVFLHSLIDFPMQGRFLPAAVFLVLGVAARASESQQEPKAEQRPEWEESTTGDAPARGPQD